MENASNQMKFSYNGIEFLIDLASGERIVTENLQKTGNWEANQLCLYRHIISQDGVFVDVGANVGINSIYAKLAVPDARVFAIEPEPRNFALLDKNVRRAVGAEISTHNVAIADRVGEIEFSGTGTNAHIASVHASGNILVPCVTLDGFIQSINVESLDLLKIDVEGYTDLVLAESSATLHKTKCAIIEFSYGDICSRIKASGNKVELFSKALDHSDGIFNCIRPYFSYFYYISRNSGLVEMLNTRDLFDIMFSEAEVGDILASKVRMAGSASSLAFAFRSILELKQQNHLRILSNRELEKSNR